MALDHILPIIPNRLSFHASFKAGVHGKSTLGFDLFYSKPWILRCRASRQNLDSEPDGGRRSREHTDLLVETLELGVLWNEFGIVGDVIVSSIDIVRYGRLSESVTLLIDY
jgi:hypothetical protein